MPTSSAIKTHPRAIAINARRFLIVQPCVVEHQPEIVDILPRIRILSRCQFVVYRTDVHRLAHNVEIVGNAQRVRIDGHPERQRFGILTVDFVQRRHQRLSQVFGLEYCATRAIGGLDLRAHTTNHSIRNTNRILTALFLLVAGVRLDRLQHHRRLHVRLDIRSARRTAAAR